MKYNSLFESLNKKVGPSIETRRYSIADMISESYKAIYACESGTNLKKLAESHLDDVRNNPTDIDRLSRNLSILKELTKLSESGEIDDKDLKLSTSSKIEGEVKESKDDEDVEEKDDEDLLDESAHDEDVEETEDEDLLEDTNLTDEEVEELTKHLEEIRKNKKMKECDCQKKDFKESTKPRKLKKMKEARDFDWDQDLWAVVKNDGTYAGVPCLTTEEARDLSANHEDSHIYKLNLELDESKNISESTKPSKMKKASESKSYDKLDLSEFNKKSSNKAFVKTFKKLDKKLHEGTALTRQEAISLYKAANSAMTHLSVELEHNPEFLSTFKESVNILSSDVSKLLSSLSEGKGPSKATMKSLAKFSEALLREEDEVDDTFVEDEEGELVSEEEEKFDQEYADARKELHDEIAEEFEDTEDPGVQEKLAQDAEEVAELTGEDEEESEEETDESVHDEDVEEVEESEEEEEDKEEVNFEDDSEITDDEIEELKRHLKEMRASKKCK